MSTDPHDRYAHLRVSAATRKQQTIERLRQGCLALKERGKPITVETIKQETGLAHTVYSRGRNPEAYAIFNQHADYFHQQAEVGIQPRNAKQRKRRNATHGSPRDPLLDRSKAELVDLAHALERELALAHADVDRLVGDCDRANKERERAANHHLRLAEVHMGCEDRIFRLERRLAVIEAERLSLRHTLLDQEGQA